MGYVPEQAQKIFELGGVPEDVVKAKILTYYGDPASGRTARRWQRYYREGAAVAGVLPGDFDSTEDDLPPTDTGDQVNFEEQPNGEAVVWATGTRITTVEQLLEACEVDLDYWDPDRAIVNKWENSRRKETRHLTFTGGKIDGEIHDDGKMSVQPLIQIKVWLVRRKIRPFEDAFDDLLGSVREASPYVSIPSWPGGDYLLVPSFLDAHFGILADDGEYTLAAAEQAFRQAGDALLNYIELHQFGIDQIILPVGNDALHVDNLFSTTTRGTWVQQAVDVRDAIKVVCRAHTDLILKLADLAPVDVVTIPGNHDKLGAFWLGMYLDARFFNDRRITVDTDKAPRKYRRYGQQLLGYDHGSNVKPDKLAFTMAVEAPEFWSKTKFREWHTGDKHHKANMTYDAIEVGGVLVRRLPALVPPDEWHVSNAYLGSKRAATVLLYHKERGPAGEFPIFVDNLQGVN